MKKLMTIAKFALVGFGLSASAAYAAAPVAVTTSVAAACCALGVCCGMDCC